MYVDQMDSEPLRVSQRSMQEKEILALMDAKGEFLPFEQVVFGDRIGKGGAGRVFRGMYCSQPCALKVRKIASLSQFSSNI